VVGGVIARRTPKRTRADRKSGTATAAGTTTTTTKAVSGRGAAPAQQRQAPAQDDDMAEIEALLKSRGIE
jgi:hypothetical protein